MTAVVLLQCSHYLFGEMHCIYEDLFACLMNAVLLYASWAFSVKAPTLWKNLLEGIHLANSVSSLRHWGLN